MNTNKFKAGDKIICTNTEEDCWYRIGEVYTVRKESTDTYYGVVYNVFPVKDGDCLEEDTVWILPADFELYAEQSLAEEREVSIKEMEEDLTGRINSFSLAEHLIDKGWRKVKADE